ncbi:RNA 2',3'-cyclic phosphodiesterase [Anaerocolumna sp.]|uniref:RNA 2',3'-cyclic phosphodiesterase n=1 Tax=Anaerocolumna sp. TaxID=2041569 RepID=UPI0028AD7C17|nr:RNA 2',3'-cyclic phosphodiesterase [Anaerocolumna sp.]
MRLFIAISFTPEIKSNLFKITQYMKQNSIKGNFTKKDNFHLTIAFIGESNAIKDIQNAMNRAIEQPEVKPFTLSIEGLGKFNHREGNIFWAGIKNSPLLSQLNKAIVKELRNSGFTIEDREYKPHLTLGRKVMFKNTFDINEFEKTIPPMEMAVNRVSLMKSETIGGQLIYTEIYHCNLI